MPIEYEEWRPGSFTKNAGWGPTSNGYKLLHEIINVGFDGTLQDVPRSVFRNRIKKINKPDYIPINFFLFNKIIENRDYIIVDELVFNALFFDHSQQFDNLALFAFNLSYVGHWKGAKPYQSRPALWAHYYLAERVANEFNWNSSKVSADDIENFVLNDKRYKAKTARKLATNLNYYYDLGDLVTYSESKLSRWWVDSLFLTLDRIIEHHFLDSSPTNFDKLSDYLILANFMRISGQRSIEKDLSVKHLLKLYDVCGGRNRFDSEAVESLTAARLPERNYSAPNSTFPIAAIHATNPRIVKTINRECAMLARYIANFSIIDIDDLESFKIDKFVAENFNRAIKKLKQKDISPNIDAQSLLNIMRE